MSVGGPKACPKPALDPPATDPKLTRNLPHTPDLRARMPPFGARPASLGF